MLERIRDKEAAVVKVRAIAKAITAKVVVKVVVPRIQPILIKNPRLIKVKTVERKTEKNCSEDKIAEFILVFQTMQA